MGKTKIFKTLDSIGGKSAEAFIKINCREYHCQKMQFRVFKNENWINQIFSDYNPRKIVIGSNLRIVKLANKNRPLATGVKPH